MTYFEKPSLIVLAVLTAFFLGGCPVVRGTGNAVEATGEGAANVVSGAGHGVAHAVEGTGDAIGQTGRELAR
jgi:hypothetical protein